MTNNGLERSNGLFKQNYSCGKRLSIPNHMTKICRFLKEQKSYFNLPPPQPSDDQIDEAAIASTTVPVNPTIAATLQSNTPSPPPLKRMLAFSDTRGHWVRFNRTLHHGRIQVLVYTV